MQNGRICIGVDFLDYVNLSEKILRRIFVELEASGRHVHVTKEQAQTLFGHGLTPKRDLSQPGQFLSNERVTVVGPKGKFENVAVLGPERKDAQVELSMTDARALGIDAPVRQSGDVLGRPGLTLANGERTLRLRQGVIVAKRHIHMTPEDAARRGLSDGQTVKLRTLSARPLVFEDVTVRVSPDYRTYAHLDYDEANACGFQTGDLGMIE